MLVSELRLYPKFGCHKQFVSDFSTPGRCHLMNKIEKHLEMHVHVKSSSPLSYMIDRYTSVKKMDDIADKILHVNAGFKIN